MLRYLEQLTIGDCLLDAKAFERLCTMKLVQKVGPECICFVEAIRSLWRKGKPCNISNLVTELDDLGYLGAVGGEQAIHALIAVTEKNHEEMDEHRRNLTPEKASDIENLLKLAIEKERER